MKFKWPYFSSAWG